MEPSGEAVPSGLGRASGFPFTSTIPDVISTAGLPQFSFKWTVNGDLRRQPEAEVPSTPPRNCVLYANAVLAPRMRGP